MLCSSSSMIFQMKKTLRNDLSSFSCRMFEQVCGKKTEETNWPIADEARNFIVQGK